jgi:hypothetical protein
MFYIFMQEDCEAAECSSATTASPSSAPTASLTPAPTTSPCAVEIQATKPGSECESFDPALALNGKVTFLSGCKYILNACAIVIELAGSLVVELGSELVIEPGSSLVNNGIANIKGLAINNGGLDNNNLMVVAITGTFISSSGATSTISSTGAFINQGTTVNWGTLNNEGVANEGSVANVAYGEVTFARAATGSTYCCFLLISLPPPLKPRPLPAPSLCA